MAHKIALVTLPDRTVHLPIGCQVDGDHLPASTFDFVVIERAMENFGYQPAIEELLILEECRQGNMGDEDFDWLRTKADAVVEWLNEHTEDGFTWLVSEQNLLLVDDVELYADQARDAMERLDLDRAAEAIRQHDAAKTRQG